MHKIVFIQSCWHKAIVDQLRDAFTETIHALHEGELHIDYVEAPGVVEIPLLAQGYATTGAFDAIVVAGLVADHGIYRHEFVAQSVLDAIMQVQLATRVPVIYGILTPRDFMSEGREAFFHEHFLVKGQEAARACRQTLTNIVNLANVAAGSPAQSVRAQQE